MKKRVDIKGYVQVFAPRHPRAYFGFVAEHVLVMEAFLGRQLPERAVIHHINRVKADNRIENLLLMRNQSDHAYLHTLISIRRTDLVEAMEEWSLAYMEDLRHGASDNDLELDCQSSAESDSPKDLFCLLRQMRSALSKKLNVPPYIIARDSTLWQVSRELPTNERELLEIKGMGPKKVRAFGKDFVSIVLEHLYRETNSTHTRTKASKESA